MTGDVRTLADSKDEAHFLRLVSLKSVRLTLNSGATAAGAGPGAHEPASHAALLPGSRDALWYSTVTVLYCRNYMTCRKSYVSRRLALEEGVRAWACPPYATSCRFGGAFACRVSVCPLWSKTSLCVKISHMKMRLMKAAKAGGRA